MARRVSRTIVGLGIAWAFWAWGLRPLVGVLDRFNAPGSASWTPINDAIRAAHGLLSFELLVFLSVATLLVPLGALVRTIGRARVRASFADPLDRARAASLNHPFLSRVVVGLPAVAWLVLWNLGVALKVLKWGGPEMFAPEMGDRVRRMHETFACAMGVAWIGGAAATALVYVATRAAVRALLAPTLEHEPESGAEADRIEFRAVAVTAETRAAVTAMAILPVAAIGGINLAHLGDAATVTAIAAYVALAAAGAAAFRRASRVAVGLDGVYVSGTSRARFFAYRDLDAVRLSGCTIELLRRGDVALRLQLHGEDAPKQTAILARVEAAIARAAAGASAAADVVATSSEKDLARLAHGAGDYRAPAVTREQLWGIVEGAEHDAHGRAAAARALAATGDGTERARLRVAAEHCAEPGLREELEALAEAEQEEEIRRANL